MKNKEAQELAAELSTEANVFTAAWSTEETHAYVLGPTEVKYLAEWLGTAKPRDRFMIGRRQFDRNHGVLLTMLSAGRLLIRTNPE